MATCGRPCGPRASRSRIRRRHRDGAIWLLGQVAAPLPLLPPEVLSVQVRPVRSRLVRGGIGGFGGGALGGLALGLAGALPEPFLKLRDGSVFHHVVPPVS